MKRDVKEDIDINIFIYSYVSSYGGAVENSHYALSLEYINKLRLGGKNYVFSLMSFPVQIYRLFPHQSG